MTDLILCPGMARAGTTWLYGQLSNPCNTGFFDFGKTKESEVFTGEGESWGWFYPNSGEGRPSVDISPYYLNHWSPWIDNIKAHGFRSVKVILMLRHPVEQLWSHYLHDIRAHISHRYMGDEIDFSLWKPETLYRYSVKRSSAVRRLVNTFGQENVLALNFHTDLKDVEGVQKKLSDFLDVPLSGFSPARENVSEGMPYYVFGAGGIETVIDGEAVYVPENTMLLVNGSRSHIWPETWQPTAARLMLMASMWTRGLTETHIARLWQFFRSDWQAVCDMLGLNVADFPMPGPITARPASLGDEARAQLLSLNGVRLCAPDPHAFDAAGGRVPKFAQGAGA